MKDLKEHNGENTVNANAVHDTVKKNAHIRRF